MKIRSGFVSNSSSSSFIISMKSDRPVEECKKLNKKNLDRYLEEHLDEFYEVEKHNYSDTYETFEKLAKEHKICNLVSVSSEDDIFDQVTSICSALGADVEYAEDFM